MAAHQASVAVLISVASFTFGAVVGYQTSLPTRIEEACRQSCHWSQAEFVGMNDFGCWCRDESGAYQLGAVAPVE